MSQKRNCAGCGIDISARHGKTKWCLTCRKVAATANKRMHLPSIRETGQKAALKAVYDAVRSGKLARPDTLACVDCGQRAAHYDHRDYNRPLDVQPVCRSCNAQRGPAIPRIREAA
jgi:hypothetical protein